MTDATPLQMAAEGGHAEVVKALVRAGASVTDENKGKHAAIVFTTTFISYVCLKPRV